MATNKDGYSIWREPTSNNSGKKYYRKKDDKEGVDYLYTATKGREVVNTMLGNISAGAGGNHPNRHYGDIVTSYDSSGDSSGGGINLGGVPKATRYREYTQYNREKLAPGQNPQGSRQPERAKQRSGDDDSESGGTYATNRNKAGRRSTILTGSRGLLGSGSAAGKTLLGGS